MRKLKKSKYWIFFLLSFFLVFQCSLEAKTKKPKPPYLILHPVGSSGFFATFSSVISVLDFYDQGNFSGLKIDLNSGLYVDPAKGSNWWNYFFEPIELGNPKAPHHVFSDPEALHHTGLGFQLSRLRAYEIIRKYVHLKPQIRQEIDAFVHNQFAGHYVIGIHHRGTDKKLEVPLVPYEKTLAVLNQLMASLPTDLLSKLKIYVATDEQQFLDYIKSVYPSLIIYSDFVRSKDFNSLHGSFGLYASNYQKGKEALIDCLLLSHCHVLIYPASSSLSIASLKFNPFLQGIPL